MLGSFLIVEVGYLSYVTYKKGPVTTLGIIGTMPITLTVGFLCGCVSLIVFKSYAGNTTKRTFRDYAWTGVCLSSFPIMGYELAQYGLYRVFS